MMSDNKASPNILKSDTDQASLVQLSEDARKDDSEKHEAHIDSAQAASAKSGNSCKVEPHDMGLQGTGHQGLERRAAQLVRDDDKLFAISQQNQLSASIQQGCVLWRGEAVACLAKGTNRFVPLVKPLQNASSAENVTESLLSQPGVKERLEAFVTAWIEANLGDLRRLDAALASPDQAEKFGPFGQDIATRLVQYFGIVFLEPSGRRGASSLRLLQDQRGHLRSFGVRVGRRHAWMSNALKPAPCLARLLLSDLWFERTLNLNSPEGGRVSFMPDDSQSPAFLRQCGYRLIGDKAFRIDMLERLTADISRAAFAKKDEAQDPTQDAKHQNIPFAIPDTATSVIGASNTEFEAVMAWLGFIPHQEQEATPPTAAPLTTEKDQSAFPAETSPVDTDAENTNAAPMQVAASSDEAPDAASLDKGSSQESSIESSGRAILWVHKPRSPQSHRPNAHGKRATDERRSKNSDKSSDADTSSRHRFASSDQRRKDNKEGHRRDESQRGQKNRQKNYKESKHSSRSHSGKNTDWKGYSKRESNLKDSPFAALAALKPHLTSKGDTD